MEKNIINRIRSQYLSNGWPQYLKSVTIDNLRGIKDKNIAFNFPVTVLVGENGSRKSTILKTSICAYGGKDKKSTYYPSDFFFNTSWDEVTDVKLEYFIKKGSTELTSKIRKGKKWSYPEKREERDVFFFDVSRTLPLDATVGYARIVKRKSEEIATKSLNNEYIKKLGYVLGKEYTNARFATSNIDKNKEIGILKNQKIGEFSQFHQGAGEDCTLDLMKALQEVPKYSLVIIDEVEASLHPKAQRRLIKFILELSLKKKIQFILSTHSPYVLEEVPNESRVLLLDTRDGLDIVYGPSVELALSRIDEIKHPELYLYVEDKNAKVLTEEIIRRTKACLLDKIEIIPAGSSEVLKNIGNLCEKKKFPNKSWVILDGDMEDSKGCFKLPGQEAPERVVFEELKKKSWVSLKDKFGIGPGDLFAYLEEAIQEEDHHLWCSKVGDRIMKSRDSVWESLVQAWVINCMDDDIKQEFISNIESLFD